MSLTLASEISDSIAIVAAVFSSAASARPASSGSAGALRSSANGNTSDRISAPSVGVCFNSC